MNKNNLLKTQLRFSSIISLIIMSSAAIYLFYSINKHMTRNEEILNTTQEHISISSAINAAVNNYIDAQIEEAKEPKAHIIEINNFKNKIKDQLSILEKFNNDYPHAKIYYDKITSVIAPQNIDNLELQSVIRYWRTLSQESITASNNFIEDVIKNRNAQREIKDNTFKIAKYIVGFSIFLVISLIIFTFYRVIQTLTALKNTSDNLSAINNDYQKAQIEINNNNWILEKSALIAEGISGLDHSKDICNEVIKIINKDFDTPAIAIYIREPETERFKLYGHHGINLNLAVKEFYLNDGFLGKIATDGKINFFNNLNREQLNINSSIVKNTNYHIIYCPLIYENLTLGLIELALNNYDEEKTDVYKSYFNRISKSIATRVRFGQSHLLVQELLEETQRQTEELEAQQEELRITNEELIHKTHLLESSEEELRVQQEELTQTNIELNKKAEELELRNLDLNNTQKLVEQKINEVELASKYKSEFMANMSHELRTPLNSILILAKLLQDNKQQNLNNDQVKYAKVIHDAGADLLELINELLDLAKIEAGHIDLNLGTINTSEFVKDVEELFKAIAKDKEIKFTTSIDKLSPENFISDEYRLQQVIKNFLSNAFKFTNPGGKVEFNVNNFSNNISFEVIDSGKGISKEKQDLIFEAFRQEDGSTSRKYGGTGLGLSISKEIASLLGGRITLESEIGVGSKFSLIIPLQISDSSTSSSIRQEVKTAKQNLAKNIDSIKTIKEEAESKPVEKRTILIIEDDVNFADILKGFAEDYNYDVILAHDGVKGIELAKTHIPSAIILDVMLPIADGWEVLKALKADDKTKHIPIHMMSAATFSKKDFIERGAIGFMHKPVTDITIQQTFENINLNLCKSVKKILLVEDQELQSDYIKDSFADHNINVIQTFSLNSAWAKLNEEKNIDCIILDLSLPDGNGLDLIEKIKEDSELSQIPIIINTAYELPKEQYDKILAEAKATILKSDKSSDRLIDEVNLFLNKLNTTPQSVNSVPTITHTNNLNGKKVLIADDDMRNVFALSTGLQNYDMKIEIANNGREAIDILKNPNHGIDIVLMDIMMPELDGYEAIKIIREDLRYKNLPILAVTAKAMKGDREKSIQIGANDYVSKPIDMDKLTSLMQVWLG